jgi:phosphoribosylamine-glycine ligase
VDPTYAALGREGLSYTGILYFGLMITADGPKVLEFNVRFGDPEAQVLLPMLSLDLGELVACMAGGTLARYGGNEQAAAATAAALGVVVASRGYPESTEKGSIVEPFEPESGKHSMVFHASTFRGADGKVRTGGGRCFTAVGVGADLRAASRNAYAAAEKVRFDGGWFRRDIGRKFFEEPT